MSEYLNPDLSHYRPLEELRRFLEQNPPDDTVQEPSGKRRRRRSEAVAIRVSYPAYVFLMAKGPRQFIQDRAYRAMRREKRQQEVDLYEELSNKINTPESIVNTSEEGDFYVKDYSKEINIPTGTEEWNSLVNPNMPNSSAS